MCLMLLPTREQPRLTYETVLLISHNFMLMTLTKLNIGHIFTSVEFCALKILLQSPIGQYKNNTND